MARVFVSYSRKNKDFCRLLTDELQKRELDFWVDWDGIPPTVDWMKEIEKGIEEADTFIAIVSPDWIANLRGGTWHCCKKRQAFDSRCSL